MDRKKALCLLLLLECGEDDKDEEYGLVYEDDTDVEQSQAEPSSITKDVSLCKNASDMVEPQAELPSNTEDQSDSVCKDDSDVEEPQAKLSSNTLAKSRPVSKRRESTRERRERRRAEVGQGAREWVREDLQKRSKLGEFAINFAGEGLNAGVFHAANRMTPTRFEEIVSLVGHRLQKQTTNYRQPISPAERIALTVR